MRKEEVNHNNKEENILSIQINVDIKGQLRINWGGRGKFTGDRGLRTRCHHSVWQRTGPAVEAGTGGA